METAYYEKIRMVQTSNGSGREEITFTEDFKAPAEEFCSTGQTVISDFLLDDMEIPDCFPLELTLRW